MARVIKTAAARKDELVDCAEALFFAKGYEATTIADILARSGLSKGAFYHHFASKEDLLDALTERITSAVIAAAQDILEDETLDALTRLNRFFARGQQWKRETAPRLGAVFATVFKAENALLYQRIVKAAMVEMTPVLMRIMDQGIREGMFDIPDSRIVSEMLLHLGNARASFVAEAVQMAMSGHLDPAAALLEQRLAVEQRLIDRILGLPEGSVVLFEPGFVRVMLAAMVDVAQAAKSAA